MPAEIDALIYDRTPDEADELAELNTLRWEDMTAAQQATWLEGRGAYNWTDWNRVGAAERYLYNLFTAMGYEVPGYTAPGDHTVNGSYSKANLVARLRTVKALKEVFDYAMVELPDSIEYGLSTADANNIEKALAAAYTLATLIQQNETFSGMVYSGQLYAQFGG